MQYKTTIEVVTEADSAYEATDIAGEFLKGNIHAGADISVKTVSATKSKMVKAIVAVCVVSAVLGGFLMVHKVSYEVAKAEIKPVTSYAIQPPLKANVVAKDSKEFQKIWEKEQKDRFNSIAR
jgi:hypothetical protein